MAKTTLTSETTCEFGGPQDNPQVSRFVEELTELSTSILLMLWFKIAKGLKSAREVMCRSPLIPWNVLSDKNVSTWPLEGSEPGDGHMYVTKFQ